MGGRCSGIWWAASLITVLTACGGTVSEPDPDDTARGVCQPLTCAGQGWNCGVTIDGCGGVLRCGTCPEGEACGGTGVPNVCGPASCTPGTCESLGRNCGILSNGCGGTLQCGTCRFPETCGGGGVPNVCGQATCRPTTCAALGRNCGTVLDGCGGTLECGTCPEGETCGGGGAPNVCGRASCTPTTCAALGKDCGAVLDGCGGTLECGTCAEGAACGGGGVPNVCGLAPCTPTTCAALEKNCGTISDGCGGTLECGTCPEGETCGGGGAHNVCGPASCQPTTCAALGKTCGTISNGCGATLDCGTCAEGQTCGGGGAPNVCGTGRCVPATCASLGKDCGLVPDGCGRMLECGTCPAGKTCGAGGVANVCAETTCRPYTCGLLGKNCGTVKDGCGGTLQCGTCPAGETCGGGGVANVCYQASSVCVDQDLGSVLPARVKGSTWYANDDHQASCGGRGAPDRGFLWTAPRRGTFTFDTARSALDSLLCLRREGCGGEELACATDGISYGGGARVTATLEAGQRVLVVVDSPQGGDYSAGDFELHIHERTATETAQCFDGADNDGDRWVDCADTDCHGEPGCGGSGCADTHLGSALPVSYPGDTVQAGDGFQGTCGAVLQQDRAHLWTAPRSGTFVFDTVGSQGNALYVLAGCRGAELACAASRTAGKTGAPVVKLSLVQGQTVLVVVDGLASEDGAWPIRYTLHINEYVPGEAGRCTNGADDDADGRADDADPDCQ